MSFALAISLAAWIFIGRILPAAVCGMVYKMRVVPIRSPKVIGAGLDAAKHIDNIFGR